MKKALVLAVVLTSALIANAAQVTIVSPSADGTLYEWDSNTNLRCGGPAGTSYTNGSWGYYSIYDLSGITGPIENATITFNQVYTGSDGVATIYKLSAPAGSGGTGNLGLVAGNSVSIPANGNNPIPFTLDVTDLVNAWLANPSSNFGTMLNTSNGAWIDGIPTGYGPQLAVTAAPEPASLALLGMGGMALLRRFKK